MKKYTVAIIGAGSRGLRYAEHMKQYPEKFQVIAVAEPAEHRREYMRKLWDIPQEHCYASWDELLGRSKFADVVIVATMDNMHFEPAMKAIELGYDLLLEKPAAQTAQECIEITRASKEKGVKVLVCHVLRYSPFFRRVKELVMEGAVGRIMSVIQVEAVGNIHQSHSYVRGDWHKEGETTPMLLAKCCHDIDIIQWLIDKPCKKVSSFGELSWFKPENAPEGAPHRCVGNACPVAETCPYKSEKIYLESEKTAWMRRALGRGFATEFVPTLEESEFALQNTNFGACVYHAGNDVVDHQVVNLEFEGGATASLTMNGFNEGGRYIRIFGTKGELYANASDTEITVYTFEDNHRRSYTVTKTEESITGGHGGGDNGIVVELYDYLSSNYVGFCAADIETSVKNHLIGFAAEEARKTDRVVYLADYLQI